MSAADITARALQLPRDAMPLEMQAFKLNWRRPAGVIHPLILHSTTVILVAEYDTGYSSRSFVLCFT